ncbi:fasciclin domain-containing protein [Chitinophaga horti]|uniref:Fasciclin domain-containing protein n=1 Tax=Chitinophaga horti TaxID=2920382 RepID=A0ABY6JB79_9BACT|nr:fasciclin domain-containing protein [Chitinophaga horti]UYQ95642.1 fasciclin domain-containing protein [Chitinophaga horti]
MKRLILGALAVMLLAVACKKEEFQQVPFGDKVPFTDTATHDLKTLVSMSNTHKLFLAAWERSHADSVLKSKGAEAQYTVFAPDDAAMRAAGYDEAAIAGANAGDMDSLVLFHMLGAKIDSSSLAPMRISNALQTMLTHQTLKEYAAPVGSSVPYWVTYRYRQYALMSNGSLFLNGKDAGNAKPVKATNGTLWPINIVANRPTQHMADFLASDPRFSMISSLMADAKLRWEEITLGMYSRNYYDILVPGNGVEVSRDAFFAPTNDAFAKSGFNTIDDLWELNNRSYPYFDWDWFEMYNEFVTDSLLAYHVYGRMYAPKGSWGPGRAQSASFFLHDLKNDLVGDYEVNAMAMGLGLSLKMPLEFGMEGGQVTVKVKGANKPAAKIIESDIYTYQGPIHVVDHLILSDKVQF